MKILSLLETAMNYMQNKNSFCRLLKTLLYYRVKHKSFKMLQLLYYFLMTKLLRHQGVIEQLHHLF